MRDVAIVGGGPGGLHVASLLARRGFDVSVLRGAPARAERPSTAQACSRRTHSTSSISRATPSSIPSSPSGFIRRQANRSPIRVTGSRPWPSIACCFDQQLHAAAASVGSCRRARPPCRRRACGPAGCHARVPRQWTRQVPRRRSGLRGQLSAAAPPRSRAARGVPAIRSGGNALVYARRRRGAFRQTRRTRRICVGGASPAAWRLARTCRSDVRSGFRRALRALPRARLVRMGPRSRTGTTPEAAASRAHHSDVRGSRARRRRRRRHREGHDRRRNLLQPAHGIPRGGHTGAGPDGRYIVCGVALALRAGVAATTRRRNAMRSSGCDRSLTA